MGSEYADTEQSKNDQDDDASSNAEPRKLTLVSDITCNDGNMELKIKSTQLKKESKTIGKSEYTVYQIVGRDSLGHIDILRRFKEFIIFREMLFSRYPGLCIPPIPSKQIQGKLQESFVEERKYFLEQFLKAICD